ncbi:Holliday junction resolvase RuvX [Candidatus Odyssella acanthamoebae]|uniref:Putative pre-16S rRNA nuclease n=1 Tax=Candidatus Odyssella acanthamoebae TaxID=91604 RepID=A0A077AWK1_9PROT|nr:Holliday junction resolvase RuvX [Candidatus Paracaedibacter acanthamoebae]AIK96394.1 Holliday junction resolvase [Candidatus Paracaedibacter acanthamoebae]
MPLISKEEFFALKLKRKRVLGLDVGNKTVGIAVSDASWLIASPLKLLKRANLTADIKALLSVYKDYNACCCVVGLPMNMNGTEGPQAGVVRSFIGFLLKQEDVPVFLWDERLSTVAVTRTLLEADLSRKRRAEVVDKMAATYILQGSLDLCSTHERQILKD